MKRAALPLLVILVGCLQPLSAQWTSWGGQAKDLAAHGGTVWVLGADNSILFNSGSGWREYPGGGRGKAIAVAPDGTPYVIGMYDGIHRGTGSSWVELAGGG